MSVTAKELAQKLGLSATAVSMALNNKAGVSTETRARIIKAAEEYGYDFTKVKHDSSHSGSIYIIFYRTHNAILSYSPIFNELYDGVKSECQKEHFTVKMMQFYEKVDVLEDCFSDLRLSDCKGIILIGTEIRQDVCRQFLALGYPLILLDTYFDGLDCTSVLINNAQASASGVTLTDHTTEQFDLALYSGLYATFYYMKACHPHLAETKGTVINFASGAGLFGNYGQCAYAAAKEGVRGLTRVAANEWGKDGINVNIICPLAWTAQLENFEKAYPDAFKQNVKMPPAGHYGDAELEIGRVCVQLASPDFKYMSGETITLEGGMGLRP